MVHTPHQLIRRITHTMKDQKDCLAIAISHIKIGCAVCYNVGVGLIKSLEREKEKYFSLHYRESFEHPWTYANWHIQRVKEGDSVWFGGDGIWHKSPFPFQLHLASDHPLDLT